MLLDPTHNPALSGTSADPLHEAAEHYRMVESYRVTIRVLHANSDEHIHYYFKKPGFVRMEFIRPHAGAALVYNPFTRRVRMWPFGAGRFPEFNLSPGNPLIQNARGQQVDYSDVGALFDNVSALRVGGNCEILGEESVGGRTTIHVIVTRRGDITGARIHCYELWLDTISQFPVKVISRDRLDSVIETVMMEDLEINPTLLEAVFNP